MGKKLIYRWRKGIATWVKSDTLYISVPFTWLIEDANKLAKKWKGKVLMGGSGLMQPNECTEPEPLLFHNPCATFTTRGCVNNCGFCAVPKLEPEFREIPSYKRMVVCILKNDHLCKYMGFSLNKTETQLRISAEKKFKNILGAKNEKL